MNGLVLMGGKSSRMQKEKASIVYHNKISQKQRIYSLLQNFCDEVFLSVKKNYPLTDLQYNYIFDEDEQYGPMQGLLAAFKKDSNKTWLVCPIDMPNLNFEVINYLIKNRDNEKDCTCFLNNETNLPDPLVCIYEEKFIKKLIKNESKISFSPKYNIMNSNVNLVNPLNNNWLVNINTIEEYNIFTNKTNK